MEFNIGDLTKIESTDSITAIDNYWDSYSKY